MRIETPEDYLVLAWLAAENAAKGAVEPVDIPTPPPHRNEIATREAVEAGVYPAEKVGTL